MKFSPIFYNFKVKILNPSDLKKNILKNLIANCYKIVYFKAKIMEIYYNKTKIYKNFNFFTVLK